MCTRWTLLALSLVACGGAPFEEALLENPIPGDGGALVDAAVSPEDAVDPSDQFAPPHDAGADRNEPHDSGVPDTWVAPPPDAPPPLDAGADTADGFTCTPMVPRTWVCTNGSHVANIHAPTGICVGGLYPLGEIDELSTPPECQCQETYHCGCVLASHANPCGWPLPSDAGCVEVEGGPHVTCH